MGHTPFVLNNESIILSPYNHWNGISIATILYSFNGARPIKIPFNIDFFSSPRTDIIDDDLWVFSTLHLILFEFSATPMWGNIYFIIESG